MQFEYHSFLSILLRLLKVSGTAKVISALVGVSAGTREFRKECRIDYLPGILPPK